MSAFSGLVTAVVAALQAAPSVASGRVFANRLRTLSASETTAVVVRVESTSATETVLGAHDWQTQVSVECYGKTSSGTSAEAAVDTLLVAVWPRLMALSPASLAVSRVAVDPQIVWDRDLDATDTVCASVRLTVQHRTPVNSLESW
ncbi:MAG: hypothetical protein RL758_345 [Pseudomonadota bacterium]|jgi:hypothetical protein